MRAPARRDRSRRIAWVAVASVVFLSVLWVGDDVARGSDDDSVVIVSDVGEGLADISASGPLDIGITQTGDLLWFDLDAREHGNELARFSLPGASRVSGELVLVADELWIVPFDSGAAMAPRPFVSWGALPESPLRDIAGGDQVFYVVAGGGQINAYDLPSFPSVSELIPDHGDPLLLSGSGWMALTGNGTSVEFLFSGGVDLHQEVTWIVQPDNPEQKPIVGIEEKRTSQLCGEWGDFEQPEVECAVVVVFPDEAVLFDGLGKRVSTVFRPSQGRTLTSVDRGDCDVLYATETGSGTAEGAVLKVVPSWRDPGCFSDVEPGELFGGDIAWLGRQKITRGCNPPANDQFCPSNLVTRGEMAAFLTRALELTARASDPFVDDDDSIFEADIEKLAAAGITKGCNPPQNDRFCPHGLVSRAEMAAFLVRALGFTDDGGGDLYVDDDVSIFESDIDKLGTAGVTKGCNPPGNDRFCPDDYVTRGQLAAFLHRALG